MLEMLLGAAPFRDVKHTGDAILCASKHELVGYGVGKYESYFTPGGKEIVIVDTVFSCVHMKVTDNASNIKKPSISLREVFVFYTPLSWLSVNSWKMSL